METPEIFIYCIFAIFTKPTPSELTVFAERKNILHKFWDYSDVLFLFFFPLQVIAIVMDMLTDIHILQDLMDAACRRSVPVYIVLDVQAVPHFLDMCSRLQIGAQHLRVSQQFYMDSCQGVKNQTKLSFGKFLGQN